MTQQSYYPPQQPPAGYPPQYPQAPQQPMQQPAYAPPPQQYAPPMQPGYPPQQYAPPMQPGYPPQQGYGQAPPQQPLAQGSLDDFYSQPSAGSGPGISWHDGTPQKNARPLGTTWVGTIVRDVTSADVQQQTSPQGVPAFFRDGRPKFQMKVPLKDVMVFNDPGLQQRLALPADMTEGEATWYVRGQARDELNRAMAEAGCNGAPAAGATVSITLVNRRPNGGGMQPSNIVQIRYLGTQGSAAAAEQPQQPAPQQVQQPVQEHASMPPQFAQQPVEQSPYAQAPPQQVPAPQQAYVQPGYADPTMPPPNNAGLQQQGQQGQQPVQQPVQQGAPQPPPGLTADAANLLAQLTGGQGQPAA